ncbi:MAG: PLP-dependent transferase, partial [Acidobacteria bacterium]|nr:PLP-dependent transferase [Acidobacteriota bacterium]
MPSGTRGLTTRTIHGTLPPDPATGAILTPIYQSTTYVQEAVGIHKGFTYSRAANPTVSALEDVLGELEGAPTL